MYYIYNMRKTILIFIACMFRACLSVMAQTLPDTTIAPAKPQGYIGTPQPSYGYSLSGGGIMSPYIYISGLSKYWRLATTQWTRLNYARLSGGNDFVGNQSFAENVYFGGTSSLTGLRNWQFVNGGDYNSPLLNGNATIGATPVQFFASRSGGFPNSNGDTEGYYPSRIEYGTNGWRFVMPTSVAGYNEFSFQTADRVTRLRLGNNGETYLQVPATATGDILTINPTTGKFGRVSASTVGGVTDFNGRNGSVLPVIGDYSSFFTTPAQVTSQITSTANKNLGGGYGVNALFYNPVSQAANVSVDTTQVKSKAGALIDYMLLLNRINAKQSSLPAFTANQILYGDGSSVPVSSTGMLYNGAGGVTYSGLDPTITVKTTATTNNSYAGFNFYNDANVFAGSIQIGGTGTAPLVRNNLFIGARIPGQSLLFVNGNVSNLTEMARFDGNGRFGVGVPSPLAWVDVKANTSTVPSFKIAASATAIIPGAGTAGGFYMAPDYRPHVVSTTVDNSIAYLTDITANARTPFMVAANATMVLNADYLNTTATQYTLTLPSTTGFPADGSKIITVLATGAGGLKVLVPSGYALQSGTSFATTTGTGGFTLTQGQKGQLIPIGTNSYYLQPLYGTITLY